jgi:GntR family transcriptional regulator
MLDKRKHIPLYIQLKDELVTKIKEGVWTVDSQIPTEKALMEEYEVGRATVREAVSLLVSEGYISKKHGIGTFVARKQPSIGFEPLISLTYSLKARGIEGRNVVVNSGITIPDKKLSQKARWKNIDRCFYLKRLRYVESRPIAIEDSYFCGKADYIRERFDLTGSLAKIILEDLNLTITKVDQSIVPRLASQEEQEELKLEEDTLILDLERWIYIEGQSCPFYYLKFIIPSNIYSFAL